MTRESPSDRLRQAAIDGNFEVVKRLARAVPNIQNPDPDTGYTTIMYAAVGGHTELVKALLDMGHEDQAISVDHDGVSVLMIAISHNYDQIFYDYVSRYPECIHAIDKRGLTALLYAAQTGNIEIVHRLLTLSADIDHVDNEGNSALHYASAWGHMAVIEFLIARECDIDIKNNLGFGVSDYAYSYAVQELLNDMVNRPQYDDSSISYTSFKPGQPYPSPLSSTTLPGLHTIAMSHGTSFSGYDSPVPRASTSSSSLQMPYTSPYSGTVPISGTSTPRGGHYQLSGSPSSYPDSDRFQSGSFGEYSRKGRP